MRFLSVLCIIIQLAIVYGSNETTTFPLDDSNVTVPVTKTTKRQKPTTTTIPPTTSTPENDEVIFKREEEEVPTGEVIMKDCDENNVPFITLEELMASRTLGTTYVCKDKVEKKQSYDVQVVSTKNEEIITTKTRTVIKTSRNGVVLTSRSSQTTTKTIDEETIIENGETTTTIDEVKDTIRTNEVTTSQSESEEDDNDVNINITIDNNSDRTEEASLDEKRSKRSTCVKMNGYCISNVNSFGMPNVESVDPKPEAEKPKCVQGETHCISAVNGHGMPNVVSVKTTTEKAAEESN